MIGKPSSSFFLNKDTDHPLLDMVHQVRDDEPMRRVSRVAPDNRDESRRNSGIKEERGPIASTCLLLIEAFPKAT